jgi:hypothetical protein
MRNLLFLLVGLILVLGIFFARDRVKRAFQLGAVLYAVVLMFRFLFVGVNDPDSFLDLLGIIAAFFVVWLIAWGGTQAILRYRERPGQRPE